jgi:hypothetical protein
MRLGIRWGVAVTAGALVVALSPAVVTASAEGLTAEFKSATATVNHISFTVAVTAPEAGYGESELVAVVRPPFSAETCKPGDYTDESLGTTLGHPPPPSSIVEYSKTIYEPSLESIAEEGEVRLCIEEQTTRFVRNKECPSYLAPSQCSQEVKWSDFNVASTVLTVLSGREPRGVNASHKCANALRAKNGAERRLRKLESRLRTATHGKRGLRHAVNKQRAALSRAVQRTVRACR